MFNNRRNLFSSCFIYSLLVSGFCVTASATENDFYVLSNDASKIAKQHESNITGLNIDNALNELSKAQDISASLFEHTKPDSHPYSLANNSILVRQDVSDEALQSTQADDTLSRLTLLASNSSDNFRQNGRASWYGGKFHGRTTASGERFDMHSMTAAHKSLPFNTYLKVTNKSNGKSVVVKVNDRGPYAGNRILDLSYGAAKKIGMVQRGIGNVTIEKISAP